MIKNKVAVWLAAGMTVLVTVLRLLWRVELEAVPSATDTTWQLRYVIMALLVVMIPALLLLGLTPKGEYRPVRGRALMPVSIFGMLAGSVMLLLSLYDLGMWLIKGATPAPNAHVISPLDGVTLALMLIFGVFGGYYLIRLSLAWLSKGRSRQDMSGLAALTPVVWIWMRLARYEMSYASAVKVTQSFYDFMMLICILLFFFSLARYVSGVGGKNARMLGGLSLCTAVFCISGFAVRSIVTLMNQVTHYTAGVMVTATDLAVGMFAAAVGAAVLFGKPMTEEELEAERAAEQTLLEKEEPLPASQPEMGDEAEREETDQDVLHEAE